MIYVKRNTKLELEEFYKAMDEDLFNDYITEDLIKTEEEFMKEEQAKYTEETKKVMLEYLAPHIDKISKLEIETNINSETFSPTILLRIWTPLCSPSDLLEKLSSTKTLNA